MIKDRIRKWLNINALIEEIMMQRLAKGGLDVRSYLEGRVDEKDFLDKRIDGLSERIYNIEERTHKLEKRVVGIHVEAELSKQSSENEGYKYFSEKLPPFSEIIKKTANRRKKK